jgi:hypothetical protein
VADTLVYSIARTVNLLIVTEAVVKVWLEVTNL